MDIECKFKVGDIVARSNFKYEPYSRLDVGVVESIVDSSTVYVKWNYTRYSNSINVSFLIPESEAKIQFSKMEEEYHVLAEQVKEKFNIAKLAMKEAKDLADKLDINLRDMSESEIIYDAMEYVGWNTSSLSC